MQDARFPTNDQSGSSIMIHLLLLTCDTDNNIHTQGLNLSFGPSPMVPEKTTYQYRGTE